VPTTIVLPLYVFLGALVLGAIVTLALLGAAFAVWQAGAQCDEAMKRIAAIEQQLPE
jgi:hypothetical protein